MKYAPTPSTTTPAPMPANSFALGVTYCVLLVASRPPGRAALVVPRG
jgi:hypothetical protein